MGLAGSMEFGDSLRGIDEDRSFTGYVPMHHNKLQQGRKRMNRKLQLPVLTVVIILSVVLAWSMLSGCSAQDQPQTQTATEKTAARNQSEKPQVNDEVQKKAIPSGATPRISFPEEIHDFGKVIRGDKLTHNFVVRNTGDAPLTIYKAKAG